VNLKELRNALADLRHGAYLLGTKLTRRSKRAHAPSTPRISFDVDDPITYQTSLSEKSS
jgi:hypothetical protein